MPQMNNLIKKALESYNNKDYKKSIKLYNKILNNHNYSSNTDLIYNRGIAYLGESYQSSYKKAKDDFTLCNTLSNSNDYDHYITIANYGLGNIKDAFKMNYSRFFNTKLPYLPNLKIPKEFNLYKDEVLIVQKEQGLGDEIMFSLAYHALDDIVKEAYIEAHDSLITYLESFNFKNIHFFSTGESLAHAQNLLNNSHFTAQATISDVFTSCYLADIEMKCPAIQELQGEDIALIPFSSPSTDNYIEKSLKQNTLDDLSKIDNISITQLMYPEYNEFNIDIPIDNMTGSFQSTLEVLKSKGLILTVDTSVAHLCARSSIPAYVIISDYYDWRWKYLNAYDSITVIKESEVINTINEYLNKS